MLVDKSRVFIFQISMQCPLLVVLVIDPEEEDDADPAATASTAGNPAAAPTCAAPAPANPAQRTATKPWTLRIQPDPVRLLPDPPFSRPWWPRPPWRWTKAGRAAVCCRLSSPFSPTDLDPDPDPPLGPVQAAIVSIPVLSVAVSLTSSPPSITLSKRPGQAL